MSRRMAALMAVILALPCAAAAQAPSGAAVTEVAYLQIPLNVPADARIRQVISKTTRTEQSGQVETGTYTAEFLNRSAPDGDGYRVTKTTVASEFRHDGAASAAEEASLGRLMQVMSQVGDITYVADTNLTPLRLHDWPRLRSDIKKAMRDASLMNPRQEEAFDALYGQVTPEGAAELFLPEDAMLAIPHNLGLSLNNPYRLDSVMEGPFGGTLPTSETLTLTAWDATAKTAEVTYESGPTREVLDAYAADIRPVLEKDPETATPVGPVTLNIGTRCTYKVSLTTGLVERAECQSVRDVQVGSDLRSQRENWVMSETLEK